MSKDTWRQSTGKTEWSVDLTKCVGCGDCIAICPVSVFTVSPPPCQTACPIHTDVASYVSLIRQERFDEALASIRQVNPFPRIMGRICTAPCEKECIRCEIDEGIAIRTLKRFTAECGEGYEKWKPSPVVVRNERVAIVGSGPAGLIAAHDLARLGYQVTVFESLPVAGGMLYVGIPEYRLPREIIKAEISQIENLGVEIRLNVAIGRDITLDALFEQGYGAILLATGAHESLKLQIPEENQFEAVLDGITFLREVNLGHKEKITGKAIIVGGGNAAIDLARTLLRLGSQEVSIIYRRTIEEMPAIRSEVIEAEREGAKIHYLVAPTRVLGEGRRVVGLECIRTELGRLDVSGRRTPIPITGSEFSMEADLVISAIGQKPNLSFLPENNSLAISEKGLIMVDTDTMTTNKFGIFAAGDNVTGPATVIDALAAGRRAAVSIDKYLRGEDLKQGHDKKGGTMVKGEKQIWWEKILEGERQKMPELSIKERSLNFNEVELGLTEGLAVKEAARCLQCATFACMDLESCCRESCRICERHCWKGAIKAF